MWKQRGKAVLSAVGAAAAGGAWVVFGSVAPDLQAAIPLLDVQQQQVDSDMRDAQAQVAADAVQQYDIVKRSGSRVDLCVSAGMAAAAFLQAKNEPEYMVWKKTERQDCGRAGIPQR